ncbi:MAG: hypothetical protein GY820_38280 [Gammaproteobacteria bacterium]|nr:hypothetical protein [Gammaproteobacteria bacterium]
MARHPINPAFDLIAEASVKMPLFEKLHPADAFSLVCSINLLMQEIVDGHCGRGHETTYETLCEMIQGNIDKCEKHIINRCKVTKEKSNGQVK